MSKIIAVHSGCDWYDASADYVTIPDGMNIDDEKKKYDSWYRNKYCKDSWRKREYYTFTEWLIKNSEAREPSSEELEIFDLT